MKITISSPDGLGDFVLRVPIMRAMLDDGHRLQVFLRCPALDLAREVFPEAEILEIAADPYHPATAGKRNPFARERRAIREFAPDLFVAAAFSPNRFDLDMIPRCGRVAGFSREGFRPAVCAEVPEEMPEIEKNRALAAAVLGCAVPPAWPSVKAGPAAAAAGDDLLKAHGLVPGGFWIACVGTRPGIRMKDWGEDRWKEFFAAIPNDAPIVFFGNPKESASIERIRAGIAVRTVNLASDPPAIPVSLALLGRALGYVGRDSGVMHLAVAAGKPVLAVYGGGHWGRFLPAGGRALVVTQAAPCRGCDFACPFPEPHCIRRVTLETMLRAWDRLRDPGGSGVEILEQPEALLPMRELTAEAARAFAGLSRTPSPAHGGGRLRLAMRALAGHFRL